MGQTFRLCVLTASFLILFQVYQFAYFVTEIPQYCWELHEVWLPGGYLGSPFWTFSIVFGLLSIWALAECWVLYRSGTIAAHRVGVLMFTLPLIAGLGVMQFLMWENLQIKAGSLNASDAWLPHYEKSTLEKMQQFRQRTQQVRDQWHVDHPNIPYDLEEFIITHTCDKGIERTSLPLKQWKSLAKEFDDIRYRHHRELERK